VEIQMTGDVDVVDVVDEVREFRRALVEWARVYLVTNRPDGRSAEFNAGFKDAIRRWSRAYTSRRAGLRPVAHRAAASPAAFSGEALAAAGG
jgi:hypothetical protein